MHTFTEWPSQGLVSFTGELIGKLRDAAVRSWGL